MVLGTEVLVLPIVHPPTPSPPSRKVECGAASPPPKGPRQVAAQSRKGSRPSDLSSPLPKGPYLLGEEGAKALGLSSLGG